MNLTNGFAASSLSSADNIYLYIAGEGYKEFWFCDDSYGPEYDHKWIDQDKAVVATNVIGMGQGFWYRSRGDSSFEWVAPRPYDLDAE